MVAHDRHDIAARNLCIFIEPDVDDFPLFGILVPLRLEALVGVVAISLQVTRLERQHEGLFRQSLRFPGHTAVLDVVHGKFLSVFVRFGFGAHGRHRADILRKDACESIFLTILKHAVTLRVVVHECGP